MKLQKDSSLEPSEVPKKHVGKFSEIDVSVTILRVMEIKSSGTCTHDGSMGLVY